MFKTFVELVNNLASLGEIEKLRKNVERLEDEKNKLLHKELDYIQDRSRTEKENQAQLLRVQINHDLKIEEAKNEIRKEMQKALIESDLARVEAVAKLQTYEKFNTKDENEHIKKMLEKAIEGLTKAQAIVNVSKA